MTWVQTFSGQAVELFNPDPATIRIEDIAHSLSMQCRYNGHTRKFYSVAEHCCLIHDALYDLLQLDPYTNPAEQPLDARELLLWALLHDAAEFCFGDIPSPLKALLPDYKEAEKRMLRVIIEKFGLSWPEPVIIKECDTRILLNERAQLLGPQPKAWDLDSLNLKPLPISYLPCWRPEMAEQHFLMIFNDLTGGKFSQ